MLGYFGNTDYDWYSFLRARKDLTEVNFWQPSGGSAFRAIPPGSPFFFKLKKPHYAIAGFGYFEQHSILPASVAWDSFGEANGAADFNQMCRRVEKYRRQPSRQGASDYNIGCIIVTQTTFFEPDAWVEGPTDWKSNIVRGSTYNLLEGEGRRVYDACAQRATSILLGNDASPAGERFGPPQLVRPRLGQGGFRIAVMDAYSRACAITTEHSLPALEAAHIRPYGAGGEHQVSNGLLLRSDIHRLFDRGYVTVTPTHYFEVSHRLKEDFSNGKSYYGLHGKPLPNLPQMAVNRPDPTMLQWHNSNLYKG